MHTLYFFDLLASGAAALGFTLLRPLGADGLVWASAGAAALAFALQASVAKVSWRVLAGAAAAAAALGVPFRNGLLAERVEPYKFLSRIHDPSRQHVKLERAEWSPIARIDIFSDRPFFFEYHKLAELFGAKTQSANDLRGVMVHYVLYFLCAVALVVSAIGIVGPLYLFQREGLKVRGLGHLAGLFACLGVGFMFVELGLIQRLNLYLGHPTYSLSVVLAGLLVFTGLGSYRAGKLKLPVERAMALGTLAPLAVSIVWLGVMLLVVSATFTFPLVARIVIVLVSLLPVGLALGIPFATALRYVERHDARFVPWAWGINGLSSVVASVLAVLVAMRIGFVAVVLIGCAIYGLAYLLVRRHFRSQPEPERRPVPAEPAPS